MQPWAFQSIRKYFSNLFSAIWARATVNTSSLIFLLLLLFLSPIQIFLQIWARQPIADAFNLLYAIDDISDLPLAFEVLVPGGPLLSCFEIPPAGTSFTSYCDTIWNNILAINNSASFQAVETTVAAAKASTVFNDYVALARPTGPPSILAGKGRTKQRPNGGRFRSGFRGGQDRSDPDNDRFRFRGSKGNNGGKQSGKGQGNSQTSGASTISQTTPDPQGSFLSTGIVSLPVGYIPETAVGKPTEPLATTPLPDRTGNSASVTNSAYVTLVLTGDSVINVPTQLITASVLPVDTDLNSIARSTSVTPSTSISTSISFVTDNLPLSTALAAATATGGNRPQSGGQGFGRPKLGVGRKKLDGTTAIRIRPLHSPSRTLREGVDRTGFGLSPTSTAAGEGRNRFGVGASAAQSRPKSRPGSLFPIPKKKPFATGVRSLAGTNQHRRRQASFDPPGAAILDASGDDGANDDFGDDESSYLNVTFTIPFNGKSIVLQPQFDQTQSNGSSSRPPRFLGMTLTGLHSAPSGTADVTFVRVPCIRGLVWAEQTLGYTLKESAVVMAFWAWISVVGILAVLIQSMSLMITSVVSLLVAIVFSVFQLFSSREFQAEYQRAVVNGVCGGVDVVESSTNVRLELELGIIGIAVVSALLAGVCTKFLLPIFGAEMRGKLEGLPALSRPYSCMIALKVLFELLSFIIPVTAALWLDAVFSSLPAAFSAQNELEEALFSCFAGFVLPWLMLGYEATRRSLCRTMIMFLVLTLPILEGWSAFFAVDLYRVWLVSWQFLAVLPVIAITLTTVVLILGIIYRIDFMRGLPQIMGHCLPKEGFAATTPAPRDIERAMAAQDEKVHELDLPHKVQFDVPSTSSAKAVEVAEGQSTIDRQHELQPEEIWTPARARSARSSTWHDQSVRWTPGRLKGLLRSSGSTTTRDRARPSRSSSTYAPGPPKSVISYSGSGTAPPSSYLASLRNQPSSPHYTDSSLDWSDRGPKQAPRQPQNVPPRPARPPRLNLRDSLATDESSKESDAEAARTPKQNIPTGIRPSGGLRVAGRFALGLK